MHNRAENEPARLGNLLQSERDDALQLRDAVQLLTDAAGYIPALVQSTLLQAYGGAPLAAEACALAELARDSGAEVVREHPATILRRPTRAPHTAPPAAQPARSDLKTASLPPRLIAVAMAMLHWPRPQPGLQQHQAAGGQDSAVGADAGGARRPLRRKMVRAVLPRELIGLTRRQAPQLRTARVARSPNA
ncbi:unnamed protein product, partial [Symbiodinium pilosum]